MANLIMLKLLGVVGLGDSDSYAKPLTVIGGNPNLFVFFVKCPRCGAVVKVFVSKKQFKALYKAFKLPISQAQVEADKHKFLTELVVENK